MPPRSAFSKTQPLKAPPVEEETGFKRKQYYKMVNYDSNAKQKLQSHISPKNIRPVVKPASPKPQ